MTTHFVQLLHNRGHLLRRFQDDAADQNVEDLNWQAISKQFGLPYDMHPCIKAADNAVLLAERDVLMDLPPIPWTWADCLEPAPVKVWGLSPTAAKRQLAWQPAEKLGRPSVSPVA